MQNLETPGKTGRVGRYVTQVCELKYAVLTLPFTMLFSSYTASSVRTGH